MTTKNITRKQQLFTQLHYQESPLLLGNVWDAHSAVIAQEAGFQALGTSSHAIAFSLGYKDGEEIPFDELLFMVERIMQVATIPVSVDFESGYSEKPKKVAKKVRKLTELGVVGINLEDSQVLNGKRQLQSPEVLVAKIEAEDAEKGTILIKADNLFLKETFSQIKNPPFPGESPMAFRLGNLDSEKTKVLAIRSYEKNTDLAGQHLTIFRVELMTDIPWGIPRIILKLLPPRMSLWLIIFPNPTRHVLVKNSCGIP